MNSELEAIMRRRRRKADGLPSPSPRRKELEKSSSISPRSRTPRQTSPPPPLPPPPSSVSATRRGSRITSRSLTTPIVPPAPEIVASPSSKAASPSSKAASPSTTRRRALDQIRARRSVSKSQSEESLNEKQQQQQDDSIVTQEAVVHGISNVDSSILGGNDDSMDVVVASAPTDESSLKVHATSPLSSPEKSVLSPSSMSSPEKSIQSLSSPEKSIKSLSSPEKSIKSPSPLSSPEKSVRSSPEKSVRSSPEKSLRSSPPSLSLPSHDESSAKSPTLDVPTKSFSSPEKSLVKSPTSRASPDLSQDMDSSVDSPLPVAANKMVQDSSSEEEQIMPSPPPQPVTQYATASTTSFAHFEADFATSFPSSNVFASHEYDGGGMFDDNAYEPPPVFEAFEPMPEPVDYTPLQNVPMRTAPTISLQESTIINGGGLQSTYHCAPTTNPLNGNIIACRTDKRTHEICIYELQVETQAQVEYTPIFTLEVEAKFKTTYGTTPISISSVTSIAAGTHHSQGQARVRVAALVEFQALNTTGKSVQRTVLLVWQWGYGTSKALVTLQSLISPPNKASFTYEASSLKMSDGLVFLAGVVKGKGPCVFSVKPYVKDVWSANVMPGSGTISSMEIQKTCKYIAIAQTDGSLSVWTFESAIHTRGATDSPKSLFPLARLYGASAIPKARQTVGDEDGYISEEQGYCTGLAWSNDAGGMLLLAAAFTHGMAIYHVALPLLRDSNGVTKAIPAPTATTQLSQAVLLPSFVAAQWASPMGRASVTWVQLGSSPCLCFLLQKETTVKAVMGVIRMPLYGSEVSEKQSATYPFAVLASNVLADKSDETPVMDLVGFASSGAALFYTGGSIKTLSPMLSNDDSFFRYLQSPTISAAPGLDSAGHVFLSDASSDSDGILQVFTVRQCKREVTDLPSPLPNTERLDWTPPKQRYLLCKSFVGDNKDAQDPSPEAQSAAGYGDIESVTCGNYMHLICDINMENLVPRRIVRCKGSSLCAVLLSRGVEHEEGPSVDASSITFIDTSKGELVGVREGRDVCFLPNSKAGEEEALVLSVDGSSIQMLRRVSSAQDGEEEEESKVWEESDSARALLGVEADDEYVEARRLDIISEGEKISLLVVGTRASDECSCLAMGKLTDVKQDDKDSWKSLIPSIEKDHVSWLQANETIQSLIVLPSYQDGRCLLAAATSSRLILLSIQLQVVAEVSTPLSTPSLAPLGSHTVAYCSRDWKLRYLCSLDGKFSAGLLATLPTPRIGHEVYQLMAVRPDRFIYTTKNSAVRLVEQDGNAHKFPLPAATTRPALLLEPMVANALSESDTPESTNVLRSVIERFGRKVAPFPHGDDEGLGTAGSGLTPTVLEMLSAYGLRHPASWLLTGTCRFDRSSNSRILPPWIPVNSKAAAAFNNDANLHIIANGDQYFSDFVKSPDQNMASTLPRPSDPSAVVCHQLARNAMQNGDVAGALKLLDVAGNSESDGAILQLALSSQLDQSADVTGLLKALSGQGDDGTRSASQQNTTGSLAALALDLKSRQVKGKVPQQSGEVASSSDDFRRRYMTQLAPSIQRSRRVQRVRHRLIGETALAASTRVMEETPTDSRWQNPCNESKHVWNEGPEKDKENLLLLDRFEDWLGRKRPAVLGKEGAEAALERGEKTLADILNKANDYDEDSFGGESAGDGTLLKDGWVEGVGEARADEDNLSLYLRMSEGADEDSTWKTDGLLDLTSYANKATLLGNVECFLLEPTSSSIDEGEPGKVKLLYDLVFEAPKDGAGPDGLLLDAPRGSSLDVGMLHGDAHDARRRCSLEFWFRLPLDESVTDEIVLARRSVSSSGNDIARLSSASDKEGFLWELVLLPSGELEFRSNGGTSLLSSSESNSEFEPNQSMGDFGDTTGDSNDDGGIVSWGRPEGGGGWNHVCLVFSSRKQESPNDCVVKMFMKGARVASTTCKILPPGLDGDDLNDSDLLDEAMKKSVYLFGLNAVADFRLTEMRLWSCERSEDDIKMMMYEYLRAAETKKKIKVRIRNKRGNEAGKASGGGLLSPPPGAGLLSPPPSGGGLLSPPRDSKATTKSVLAPPPAPPEVGDSAAAAADARNFAFDASFRAFEKDKNEEAAEADIDAQQRFLREMLAKPPPPPPPHSPPSHRKSKSPPPASRKSEGTWDKMQQEDALVPTPGYSRPQDIINLQADSDVTAPLPSTSRLSKEVRSSAAAALVRGPPATRHFGGNRGGLSRASPHDRNLRKRYGVGAIAICGAEKTVVYDHDEEQKGKTYPIGASGAIISDEMDNGEYLCCFLAKDKRMVVFELLTRTVVVELQMTTKLNYWRYLPPQAHGHTLVFMLITPVGGFHWVPLDESPRPIQVWKRGPPLQGKKIVTYEEGGSNGFAGSEALSAVALLLVSTASTGTPLEAWILQVGGESQALCVSNNVLGAALFRPYHIEDEAFLPHLVTAQGVETEIVLKVEPLSQNPATGELAVEDVSIGAIIDQSQVRRTIFTPPALAMGGWPEVICCTCQGFVVACVRRKGLVVAYDCQEELVLVRQEHVENFIVDGALRPGTGGADVELMLLLADSENPRDGFVMSIDISKL